jgi:putative N6-adenine-specific DNA methylase
MGSPAFAFFAACARGIEPALVQELQALGATEVEERRGGVAFRGDRRLGYGATLWLRSATRVQEELLVATVESPSALYEAVRAADVARWITPSQTVAVFGTARDHALGDPHFLALRVKDAVVDAQRAAGGARSSVDTKDPDVPLKLVVHGTTVRLYRDWSGDSLHKRGWRPIQVKSPLNEAVAAGLILLSDWDRASPVVDPMCGSGTFVIEAAMLAARRAPGLGRAFTCERFPDHDRRAWTEVRDAARAAALPALPFRLVGADRHAGALGLARRGAQAAGVAALVEFVEAPVATFAPPVPPAVVFVNPPWGERLQDPDLVASWRDLGTFLHDRCPGAVAWVLSGNADLTRHLRLKKSASRPVKSGPIDARWLRYEVRADRG